MEIGDLVTIVQSKTDKLFSPHVGKIGVIIEAELEHFENQDSFSVMTCDEVFVFGANYLEVINECG